MVLVGVQPSLTQGPPTCSRSISAVRRPAPASAIHSGVPPWPEPITIAWYRSGALIEELLGAIELYLARRLDARRARLEPRHNKKATGNCHRVFQKSDDHVRNLESLHQARANFVTRKSASNATSYTQDSAERDRLRPRYRNARAGQATENNAGN